MDFKDKEKKRAEIEPLTGIRFLAALFVLLFHFGAGFTREAGMPGFVSNILSHGYLGVSLFFVLSGFILTYAYTVRAQGKAWISDFFLARFARIYPVYIAVLLFALPLALKDLTLPHGLLTLLMLQAWTSPTSALGYSWVMQAWTLSVEFAFYLSFPLWLPLIRKLDLKATSGITVILCLIIVACATPTLRPLSPSSTFSALDLIPIPLLRMPEFLLGMCACRLTEMKPRWIERLATAPVLIALAAILLMIWSFPQEDHATSLSAVIFGLALILIASNTNSVTRCLSSKPMLLLGAASYCVYLLQGPVHGWFEHAGHSLVIRILSVAVTIALAILVYLFYETPARHLILKLSRHGKRIAKPAIPPVPPL